MQLDILYKKVLNHTSEQLLIWKIIKYLPN